MGQRGDRFIQEDEHRMPRLFADKGNDQKRKKEGDNDNRQRAEPFEIFQLKNVEPPLSLPQPVS
ncbi:hypothetical protein D3C76_1788850 [compost metagenome]